MAQADISQLQVVELGTNQQRFGLIILGNSGAGKSFLANLFLQVEKFIHKVAPSGVTKVTEFEEYTVQGVTYVIFNIPGLVEAKQAQIDTNKAEIDKAFEICPNAVVIYVFGTQNGRIRSEDVIAFNALSDAYPFESKSLVLAINNVPQDREENYEGETIVLLRGLIKLDDTFKNFCFLDWINKRNNEEKMQLRDKLLQAVMISMPKVHKKQHDIHLEMDEIKGLTNQIHEMQKNFDEQRGKYLEEFIFVQKHYQEEMNEQRKAYRRQLHEHEIMQARFRDEMDSYQKKNDELQKQLKEQAQSNTVNPMAGLLLLVNPYVAAAAMATRVILEVMKEEKQ
jgi:hypothetical protein